MSYSTLHYVGTNNKVVGKCDHKKLSYAGAWQNKLLTLDQLAEHIGQGHPWMPSILGGDRKRRKENANYAELIALDHDDGLTIQGAQEHDYIAQFCALAIETSSSSPERHKFRTIYQYPEILTYDRSGQAVLIPYEFRQRIAIYAGETSLEFYTPGKGFVRVTVTQAEYDRAYRACQLKPHELIRICNRYLQETVGGADPACKDPNRFFFGGLGRTPFIRQDVSLPADFFARAIAWNNIIEAEIKAKQSARRQQFADLPKDETGNDVADALQFIAPYTPGEGRYDSLITMMAGVLNDLGSEGEQLLIQWDAGRGDWGMSFDRKLASLTRSKGNASLGTLFHMAKAEGYKRPKRRSKTGKRINAPKKKTTEEATAQFKEYQIPEQYGFTADVTASERYLTDVMLLPEVAEKLATGKYRMINVKGPQGCGKSTFIEGWVHHWHNREEPVFFPGNRQGLERAQAERYKVPCKADTPEARQETWVVGQAFTVMAARKDSQLNFDGATFKTGHTVWDEANSTLRDLVESSIVPRAKVLPELSEWMRRVGLARDTIVLLDANLTDMDVAAYAKAYGIPKDEILNIENKYNFWEGKQIIRTSKAAAMHQLEDHCKNGGGPVWCTATAQKPGSSYGTNGIKALLEKHGRKVLVLDSSTVCDPQHPASNIMSKLQEEPREAEREIMINGWDVVHSPSIEAGLSIEIYDHFSRQFSFVSGNLLPESVTQQIFRLRDPDVPVTLGVDGAMHQCLRRGNGGTTPEAVEAGELARQQSNIHQLIAPGIRTEFLDYWYQDSARVNAMLPHYGDHICKLLEYVGCTVTIDQSDPRDFAEEMKQRSIDSKHRAANHACKVAAADEISDAQYRAMSEAKYKGFEEQCQIEKHSLGSRYKVQVEPGLAILDTLLGGFYGALQMQFYLTCGREHLKARDQKAINSLANKELGEAPFLPDLNNKCLGHKIAIWERLGLTEFDAGEQIAADDPRLAAIAFKLKNDDGTIAALTGREFGDNSSVVRWINELSRSDIGRPLLVSVRTKGPKNGKRSRVYEVQAIAPEPILGLTEEAVNPAIEFDDTDNCKAMLATLATGWTPHLLAIWLEDAEQKKAAQGAAGVTKVP